MEIGADTAVVDTGAVHARQRTIVVVVPTFRRPKELRAALASIASLRRPEWRLSVIVADNALCPETREIAKVAGARYLPVNGKNCASTARNAALTAADGEFIAFLDDDDAWLSTHLAAHIALLDRKPELDAAVGRVISADHKMRPVSTPWPAIAPTSSTALLRSMLSGYYPQLGSVVVRGHVPQTYGMFDESLVGGEDLDWLLRIARRGRLGFAETESVLFRQRPRGSFDALQISRAGFDRRVFLRHALRNWRLWEGPRDFSRGWYGTLRHHYTYFVDAAVSRASSGQRLSALKAVVCAIYVFPLRGLFHIAWRKRLGKALAAAMAFKARRRAAGSALGAGSLAYALEPLAALLAVAPL